VSHFMSFSGVIMSNWVPATFVNAVLDRRLALTDVPKYRPPWASAPPPRVVAADAGGRPATRRQWRTRRGRGRRSDRRGSAGRRGDRVGARVVGPRLAPSHPDSWTVSLLVAAHRWLARPFPRRSARPTPKQLRERQRCLQRREPMYQFRSRSMYVPTDRGDRPRNRETFGILTERSLRAPSAPRAQPSRSARDSR
jgi:hypothetical protein